MSAYEEDRELESEIDSAEPTESVTAYLYNGETFDESSSYRYLRARCYGKAGTQVYLKRTKNPSDEAYGFAYGRVDSSSGWRGLDRI